MRTPLNRICLEYRYDLDTWDFWVDITQEMLEEYYQMPIHKDLFPFINFDLLYDNDYNFATWLKNKFKEEADEEYKRYCL